MESWLVTGLLFAALSAVVSSKACDGEIGVSNPSIFPDSAFTASSDDGINKPHFARLNGINSAWCSNPNDIAPFIRVQLPSDYRLTGVGIKGLQGSGSGHFVSKYRFSYLYRDAEFSYLLVLDGPVNQYRKSTVQLDLNRIIADAIIIRPTKFSPANDKACLQLELYGCPLQAPTTAKPTSPPTTPVDHCKIANGGCQQVCSSQASGAVCSCNNGFILDQDGKSCNVDYCMASNGGCEVICSNSKSGPVCSCHPGFKLKSDGKNCTNINECSDSSNRCDRDSTFCVDTIGSYRCYCKSGYGRKNRFTCEDKDECSSGQHSCNQVCINIKGSYRCGCYDGFQLDRDGRMCNDINECNQSNKCDTTLSACVNTRGNYECQCFSGLVNDVRNRFKCVDKNECDYNNGNCEHICTNSYRSYKCSCRRGFHLSNDSHACIDNDECATNNGGCDHRCINFPGGYRCTCRTGFNLESDHHSCSDIDECGNVNGGCEKYCNNTIGSFFCSCDQGYEVKNKLCEDINECTTKRHNCDTDKSTCYNTQGSFECRCNQGYERNPVTQRCEAKLCRSSVAVPANGIVEPSRCLSFNSNKYGDACSFRCNAGYKLTSTSAPHVYCDSDGFFKQPPGTTTPICERIRCPPLSGITNGQVYPIDCRTKGIEFGRNCHMGCNGGYSVKGITTIKCQQDGKFDGSFSQTKCVARPTITCPPDMEETLPLGVGEMLIKLGKINTNVDSKHLASYPAGVVDGTYKFKPGYTTVKLVASNEIGGTSECSFGVRILDKEPPKVLDCDTENQYINIDAKEAIVTWKEPRFVDNAGLHGNPSVNIANNVLRKAQVYFVAYIARDTSGNKAACKFFVHVNAKYCSQDTMPGGIDASVMEFGASYFLSCANNLLLSDGSISTFGVGTYGKAECSIGQWTPSEIPSCVVAVPKSGDCPVGTQSVSYKPTPTEFCANCPPGRYNNQTAGKCTKCPKGFYQDVEKQSACKQCPAGSTTVSEGSVAVSACKAVCSKGSYSKDGLMPLVGCTKCPQGSYQDLDGESYCKICPKRGDTPGDGTTDESNCYVNARITKVLPASQEFVGVIGDNVTIECWATGSPPPHLAIVNATVLPPENLRGSQKMLAQPSTSKYVAIRRLTITNAQIEDTALYKCIAQNPTINSKAVDERKIKVTIKAKNAV